AALDGLKPLTDLSEDDQQKAFENLVDQLSQTRRFQFSSFYRIRSVSTRWRELRPKISGMQSEYRISGNGTISIALSFFHGKNPLTERRRIKLTGNEDLFSGDIGREIAADLPYNDLVLRLLPRPTLQYQ